MASAEATPSGPTADVAAPRSGQSQSVHAVAFVGHSDECLHFQAFSDADPVACQEAINAAGDEVLKKLGGFATGTKASATEGDCFLGEVSRPSGLAVFAYVTATGIRILAATRQVAVSTPGITQFFRSLHSLFVEAVCNPLATGGPDDSAGVHLGSPWFKAALAERVNQANVALQYKPLPTPSVPPPLPGTGRAQGTRVAQAFEAYASGRSQA